MDQIIQAIALPESWQDRMLARLHLEDEVKRVEEERRQAEQRLKRLGQVYLDGLKPHEDYLREKRQLEDRLQSLVVPGVNAAQEAGKLLENLPDLWAAADLAERRKILLTMLEAVYVDPVEERSIVAFRPKPAFQALFQMAAAKEGSGVALINQDGCPSNESVPKLGRDCGETAMCSWWRRGRVELPVQKAPRSDILQAYPVFCSRLRELPPAGITPRPADLSLTALYRRWRGRIPDLWSVAIA
jgi:hypothetical protein